MRMIDDPEESQSNRDSQGSTSTTSLSDGTVIVEAIPSLPLAVRMNEDPNHVDRRATSRSAQLLRSSVIVDASAIERSNRS